MPDGVGRVSEVDLGKLVVSLERLDFGPEKLVDTPEKVLGPADGIEVVDHLGVAR